MLAVLRCCGFFSFVLRSGEFVGHVFVNLDQLIQVWMFCDLKIYFSSRFFCLCFNAGLFFGDHACVEGNA